MALVYTPVLSEYVDFSKFAMQDLTGVYAVTNPGGWEAPNPAVNTALSCSLVITKPDPVTLLPSGDVSMQYTKNIWFGFAGGVMPNTAGTFQYITALELGYTDEKLPTGIFAYDIMGTGNDGGAYTFVATGYIIATGQVDCCITKMRNRANIKDCHSCFEKNSMAANAISGRIYIDGALMAFKHGNYDTAAAYLKRAEEICNGCVPCKC